MSVKAVEAGKSVESGKSEGLVYRVSCIVERLVFSWAGFSPSISTACFSARTIRLGGIGEIGGDGAMNVTNVMNVMNVMPLSDPRAGAEAEDRGADRT